ELEAADLARLAPLPLGKDHQGVARAEQPHGLARGARVAPLDVDGKGAEEADEGAETGDLEEPAPGHVMNGPTDRDGDEGRIGEGLVVGRDDERARGRDVLRAVELEAEVETTEAVEAGAEHVEDGRAHAKSVACAPVLA